jgi:hypothetical protein
MVTEYEALGTLMGTILTLSGPGIVCSGSRDVARHEPVAQSNCKTAAWTLQILSPGARSPKGLEANDSSTPWRSRLVATHGSRGRDVGVGGNVKLSSRHKGDPMGFMDKVKEQAASAASAAKDAAAKGQAKVGEVQAKRGADGVLRQLGLAAYLQTQNRAPASTDSDIEKYIETLKAYESEHGELSAEDSPSS